MRSWDDNFHCNEGVTPSQNCLVTLYSPSLNLSSPPQLFCNNTNSNGSLELGTTDSDISMKTDSNSSKKRKRKGSMDVTNIEDDSMVCSFLENLLQSNSNANTAQPKKNKQSKRTKRSSADVLAVIPQTTTSSYYTSAASTTAFANSLTYCNNNHYQTKYQMSVSYSTSFLK
ncbi:predicted protein [Naegleria gruberi]|uniref:Predicted protein n=1 Tax=Naegleria gruberi TaxID=5762 RepID=D2VUH9_NAEGR|nr:uncharacterized protein NAEGRDRAFT_81274 [Naegleria gruberi]EFC39514.1 predicted protein [Naegleria gruberi]|eukprot:XP_002672258.1 predicted protein [Naegleria gruberi strain NEG-M]